MSVSAMGGSFDQAEVISSISRAGLLEDGSLVDVTDTAKLVGITVPVAVTRAVWLDCMEWDKEDSERQILQDQIARAWDVLWNFKAEARENLNKSSFLFEVERIPRGGNGFTPMPVKLKAVLGPGDTPAPVITIMQPDED